VVYIELPSYLKKIGHEKRIRKMSTSEVRISYKTCVKEKEKLKMINTCS
jgi:hypothetical protein